MADEVKAKTLDELKAELQTAMDKGDWKGISGISQAISKLVNAALKAEQESKQVALKGITEKVMKAINKAIQPFIDDKSLDIADGVWFSNDFGEALTDCRLLKSTKVARTGGGGGGKKFDIKTSELLALHGSETLVGQDGRQVTFQEAYDSNTDGNYRYGLRNKMLKLSNMS